MAETWSSYTCQLYKAVYCQVILGTYIILTYEEEKWANKEVETLQVLSISSMLPAHSRKGN